MIPLYAYGWLQNTDPVSGDVYDVHICTASMASSPKMNPNARIYYLDNNTLEVLDMDTYFMDLQDPISKYYNYEHECGTDIVVMCAE